MFVVKIVHNHYKLTLELVVSLKVGIHSFVVVIVIRSFYLYILY